MNGYLILLISTFALALGQNSSTTSQYAEDPNYVYTPDYYVRAGNYSDQSCTQDYDCFGMNRICLNGTCACPEGYTMQTQDYYGYNAQSYVMCISPPAYLFAPCQTICQKPYACKENTNNYGYNYGYYNSYNGYQQNDKVCQCSDEYEYIDGTCVLNCTADEVYDQSKYKCIPRCKANEIKIEDDCKPLAAIGGQCDFNQQCMPAYSECVNNKCACRDGFGATKDGICSPKTVTCPSGFALRRGNGYRVCQYKEQPFTGEKSDNPYNFATTYNPMMMFARPYMPAEEKELKHDCPANYFCMLSGGSEPTVNSTGYCCPKLKTECPIGKAHSNASCQPRMYQDYCPWETHTCYGVMGGKQMCCPKPCPGNSVLIKDKCYPTARIGDSCSIKEQCTDSMTDCINGKCQCGRRSVVEGTLYKYCRLQCEVNEIEMYNECYPYLKVGDKCQGQEYRCPTNTYCGGNGTCQCYYGMVQLTPNICAGEPSCPSYDYLRSSPMPAVWDEFAYNGTWQSTANYQEPDEKSILAKINSATFCKLKNQTPPKTGSNVVDTCPAGEFCSYYLPNMGVCCKKPEPYCLYNAKITAVKQCDYWDYSSCGANSTCFQYYYSADNDDAGGRVCCERTYDW